MERGFEDRQKNRQTFVIVESLLQLKTVIEKRVSKKMSKLLNLVIEWSESSDKDHKIQVQEKLSS